MSDGELSIQAERNVWNTEEREVLVQYVQAFKDKDKHQRRKLLASQVLPEFFKKCRPDATGVARQHLKSVIRDWFYNQCRSKEPAMKIWPKRVSLRNLVIEEFNDKIKAMAMEEGVRPADPKYIGVFQDCASRFIENMTEEEITNLERKKKDMDKGNYSQELAIKAAKKNGPKLTRAVDRVCFQKMGMRRITWEMHLKEPGKMVISGQDYMNELTPIYGKSFKDMHPKVWAMWAAAFAEYARYILSLEQGGSPDISAPEYIYRELDETPLERCPDGYPILPDRLQRDGKEIVETAEYAKRLMRKFLAEHYAVACQVAKASVPYTLLSVDPSAFAAPHFWPPAIAIKDPSSMIGADVHKVLDFWRQRKATYPARDVFRFRQVLKGRVGHKMMPSEYPKPPSEKQSTPAPKRQAAKKSRPRQNKRKSGPIQMLPNSSQVLWPNDSNTPVYPPLEPIDNDTTCGSEPTLDFEAFDKAIEPHKSLQVSVQGGPDQIPPSFGIDDPPMPYLSTLLPSLDHSMNGDNDLGVLCQDILPVTNNLETHPLTAFNRQYGKLQSATPPEEAVLFSSSIPTPQADIQIPSPHQADTDILSSVTHIPVQKRPKPKARQGIALTVSLEDTLGKNPNRSNFLQGSSTASLQIPPSNPRKRSRNDGLDLSLMNEDCGKGKRMKRTTARARGGE